MAMLKVSLNTANVRLDDLMHDLSSREIVTILRQSCQSTLIPPMKMRLQKNNSVYMGKLIGSIDTMTARVNQGEASAYVGPIGVKYAMNIEKGMKPHTPDYGNIIDWVRRKLKPNAPVPIVAGRIVRAIQKRGIAPKPYLLVTLEANQGRLSADLTNRIQKHLRT